MRRFAIGVVMSGVMGLGLTACPDSEFKASTWTKKLDDQKDAERAVDKLEQLGDPSAIEALGKAWEAQGKPVRFLQVLIGLARPLSSKQAADAFLTDYPEGRGEHWNDALPFLQKAISEVDETNPRSVDSAQKAADALGEAKLSAGLPQLIELASKPQSKKLTAAQISAVRAIGKMDNDKSTAAGALIKLVEREPPAHPKTATKDTKAAVEEKYGLFIGVTGAAINGLGDLRISAATKPLILQMYRTPELFMQIRRAMVASGPSAVDELGKVLRGTSTEVNQLFTQLKLDEYRGDKGDAPSSAKVSAKDFYPAVVLGDFYDPKSVKDLLAALDLEGRPPLPVYYINDNPSPNTQYNGIFDSIRKIGSAEAEPVVRKFWSSGPAPAAANPKKGAAGPSATGGSAEAKETARILAIGVYPFVARDSSAAAELAKIADSPGDNQIRQEAATAFARLSTNPEDIKVLLKMAKVQQDAAAKQHEFAAKEKPKADAADKTYEDQKKAVATAKAEALKSQHSSDAEDVKKARVKEAKDLEDKLKGEQKKAHNEAVGAYRGAVQAEKDLNSFSRLFETHIARIVVAIRCKDSIDCFAKTLTMKPDQAIADVQPYMPPGEDIAKTWSKEEKMGLVEAEVERGMLEIGKKGAAAGALTDTLLDAAKIDDRLIRQSVLLALPKIAKVPCANCEAKLDAAIKAGEGKASLGDLQLETTMLRNYFSWAGGKTPSAPSAAPTPAAPTPAPAPAEAPAPAPEKAEAPAPAPAPAAAPAKAPTKAPPAAKKKGH